MTSWRILHTESSTGWGGQEHRIVAEVEGMIGRGHRAWIAAPPEARILARAQDRGIETIAFPMQGPDMFRSIGGLARLIRREGVQIVNTHSSRDSWLAAAAALVSRPRPVLIRTRHLSTPIRRSLVTRLIYNTLPNAVVTTGEEIRRTMIEEHGFDPGKIVSIPTGIDTGRFTRTRYDRGFRRAVGVPDGAPLVGNVAVLRSWKGHEDFVDAARLVLNTLPEARFVIVGDGPRLAVIREHIEACGLTERVVMAGHRDDVPAVLAGLDVFVLSSFGHEGVPQSVLQALAMEVPVVATDVGAVSEVIHDGRTGVLARARDPKSLADGVVRLLTQAELRRSVVSAGRALVEKDYTLPAMLDRTEDLYRRCLSSPPSRAAGRA